MRTVDNSELVRWRELDSSHVLRLLADHIKQDMSFHPRSSHLATRWHAHIAEHDWEFLCTGPKFWDMRMDRGGGGAIDLVMHIYGSKFKGAVMLLKDKGL